LIRTRDVADRFSPTDQRMFRFLGTVDCLRLRTAAEMALVVPVEPVAPVAA
jgi:hypothetical protein